MSRDNASPDDLTDEEGLRVCAVCGERKQTWFEVEGLIARNKVPCMCKCERDRLAAEEEARKRQEMALRIDRYRRQGMTDEQYRGCTFDVDDQEDAKASQFCRAYAGHWEWAAENNAGLLLWGDVGGGKTFLAACIANALIDKGIPATMTTLPRLVNAMQRTSVRSGKPCCGWWPKRPCWCWTTLAPNVTPSTWANRCMRSSTPATRPKSL